MRSSPVIAILRSTSVRYEPVVRKRARVAVQSGLEPVLIYWVRAGSDQPSEEEGIKYVPIVSPAVYGKGLGGIHQRIRFMREAMKALEAASPSVIQALDFDMMVLASWYKLVKRRKVKIIYDILDFIYEFESPMPGVMRRALRRMDAHFFRSASAILLPDPNREAKLPLDARKKVSIIYNAPELPQKTVTPRATQDSRILVFYAGGFSPDRGLTMLMEAVAKMPQRYRLVLAGQGVDAERARQMSRQHENIEYLGQISGEDAVQWTCDADLLYAAYDPAKAVNRLASPNKFFEAVTFGKPIIVAEGTSIDERVKQLDCGWAIPFAPQALEMLLAQITREQLAAKSKNASKGFETFGWPGSAQRLMDAYRGLAG